MSKQVSAGEPISIPSTASGEGFDCLADLALDLRWSWNHATDNVGRQLDPALWELTQNPWVVLQTVSKLRRGHVGAGGDSRPVGSGT